ncbi:hypothetical protein [Paenibacillus puerhi]|uniref:hypothetical protein n=1 Tax=Paenibacillus puerhi TaxID=2692622 RepID=UPI00135C539E|nr:hypothetical protein [Paenibacillus puerhi]
MKRKNIIIGTAVLSLAILSVSFINNSPAFGNNPSKYDIISNDIKNHIPSSGPDGKEVKLKSIDHPGNKDKVSMLKKEKDIEGFVPEVELTKKGGKYTKKSLMTYQEYIDSETLDGIRHDIHPERMVWVFTAKFDKTQYIEGKPVEKANITTLYDAETGEFLSITVTSDDPNGLKELTKRE